MTVYFPDVSHYEAGLDLAGSVAVIAKATQGTSEVDPSYAGFKAQAAQLGIPFAAYHWVTTDDVATQAAHAHSVIGSVPMMWDAEAAGATVPRLLDLTARNRALGGNPRLAYLPHWWWQQLGSPDLRPLLAAGLCLVSSNYPAGGYSDIGPGWAPYGGVTPVIWQFTDAAPMGGQRVDRNAYRSTVDQFRQLLGLAPASNPVEDDMHVFRLPSGDMVVTNGVTYRHLVDSGEAKADYCVRSAYGVGAPTPVTVAMLDGRTEEQWLSVACGVDTAAGRAAVDGAAVAAAMIADPLLLSTLTKAIPAGVAAELAARLGHPATA